MSAEFNLIDTYFKQHAANTDLGIGDDAALVRVSTDHQLAISTDILVSGTHFFADANPYDIGWKSLAVNISDMAAMGTKPKWVTLGIVLPDIQATWLSAFANGFFACAKAFDVALIGGDTTRGPLAISVTIMGETPTGQALQRDGAKADDDIWVTGELGSAAVGLAHLQDKFVMAEPALSEALKALHQPQPRVAIGNALSNIANSCIDISDGFLADLSHILKASNLGATIYYEKMPVMGHLSTQLDNPLIQQCILAGGDDYELCFTAPQTQRAAIQALAESLDTTITRVGETTPFPDLVVQHHGKLLSLASNGYDHFTQP